LIRYTLERFTRTVWRLKNIYQRWRRWSANGVWEKVFKYLAADSDNEYGMIDSTIVRAHQHSAGAIKKNEKNDQTIGKFP